MESGNIKRYYTYAWDHLPPIVRMLVWLSFAGICITPLFFSLGDHPIHGDSEARYGVIARGMALGQTSLLVPTYFDEPHLTKPPLTYWLMAGSIWLLGDGELALRMPAALSGVGTLAIVFGLAYRLHGRRRAVIAAAIVSVTPMFVVVHRMGITDGPLGLCCTAAFAAGFLATTEYKVKYNITLWFAVGLALLVKGPVGLLPPAVLLLWLGITGQWSSFRRLRPMVGLALAILPLAAWVFLIAWNYPEAWVEWRYQLVSRAVGTGDHPEAWWYFVPVFILGFLPATALFVVYSPKRELKMNSIRWGEEWMLWTLAVLITVALFSLMRGKLMSYLLPLVGPVAWLAAGLINPPRQQKPARIRRFAIVGTVVGVSLAVITAFYVVFSCFGAEQTLWLWPILPMWLAIMWWAGHANESRRHRCGQRSGGHCGVAAALVWLTLWLGVVWSCWVEDQVFGRNSVPTLVGRVQTATGLEHPHILTVGFSERSLPYYSNRSTRRIDPRILDEVWAGIRKDDLILVADPLRWDVIDSDPNWRLEQRFEPVDMKIKYGYEGNALRIYRVRPELW